MKSFTDLFIQRPVLAIVISILICFFGLRALSDIPLRMYPKMQNGLITIETTWPASVETVQNFVTDRIEKAIANTDGIDYLTSRTTQGSSHIEVHLKEGQDNLNELFNEISAKVSEVRGELPKDSEAPTVRKDSNSHDAMMYLSFNSEEMRAEQMTDYIDRMIKPNLESIDGMASASIFGGSEFALRIWLDPKKMAAYQVDTQDIVQAINSNQILAQANELDNTLVKINLQVASDFKDLKQLQNITIKSNANGHAIRLKEIARIELGASSTKHSVSFNGKPSVFIAIHTSPKANPLIVIPKVRQAFYSLQKSLPPNLKARMVFDASEFIEHSIKEVIRAIVEAIVIVLFIIFVFLGRLRSMIIPMVTIPISLIGMIGVLALFGYSLNLLTLLAMVLAIGLVVDDAIVVLENIHRHLKLGKNKFDAALEGAREIASPIISMTITLAAVYTPIAFIDGITGGLFKEFVVTLAGSVILSGVIALTLSPMMCSFLLENKDPTVFEKIVESSFRNIQNHYTALLSKIIHYRKAILILMILCFVGITFLLKNIPKELIPIEDERFMFVSAQSPDYANLHYTEKYTEQFKSVFEKFPEIQDHFIINEARSAFAGLVLTPWDQRTRSPVDLQGNLQKILSQNPGLNIYVIAPNPLPMFGSSLPIQFVVSAQLPEEKLAVIADELKKQAMASGEFTFLAHNLNFKNPQFSLEIDRDKAAEVSLPIQHITQSLSAFLSNVSINKIAIQRKSYDIILQAEPHYRDSPEKIASVYVKNTFGQMIPLSLLTHIHMSPKANALFRFQQKTAFTISGLPAEGSSIQSALHTLKMIAERIAPSGSEFDYLGLSRQLLAEGNTLTLTFIFSISVIFLVLAAQFNSFVTPVIILVTVPLSIIGALLGIYLMQHFPYFKLIHQSSTLNIYSGIGLITLIGLITKHGILLVEFANNLHENKGLSIENAILESAATRLRPILMTTFAMILGVVPLLISHGPGALSRITISLVLIAGLAFGTLFTLMILPTIYVIIQSMRHRTLLP